MTSSRLRLFITQGGIAMLNILYLVSRYYSGCCRESCQTAVVIKSYDFNGQLKIQCNVSCYIQFMMLISFCIISINIQHLSKFGLGESHKLAPGLISVQVRIC